MHRVQPAPLAHVVGDVVADAHDPIGTLQHLRLGGTDHRTVRAEGHGDGCADQVNDPGPRGFHREIEQELPRIVSGGNDDVGVEFHDLGLKKRAQMRTLRKGPDVHTMQHETRGHAVGNVRLDSTFAQLGDELVMPCDAEALHPGGNSDLVPARGQILHQQPVRLVAAARRGEIGRVVGQQDTH